MVSYSWFLLSKYSKIAYLSWFLLLQLSNTISKTFNIQRKLGESPTPESPEDVNPSPCKFLTFCYSCFISKDNCFWDSNENQCISSIRPPSNPTGSIQDFLTCDDAISKLIANNNCGKWEVSNDKISIEGSKLYDFKSDNNIIFCTWTYKNTEENNITIKIKKNALNSVWVYEIYNGNTVTETITINTWEAQKKDVNNKNYNYISIYYYSDAMLNEPPFDLEIEKHENFNFAMISMYIVSIICLTFLIIIMALLGFCCKKIITNASKEYKTAEERSSDSELKAPKKVLDELDLKKQNFDGTIKMFNIKCPICLDNIVLGNEIVIWKCGHGFHSKCILHWITENKLGNSFCPWCHKVMNKNLKSCENEILNQRDHRESEIPRVENTNTEIHDNERENNINNNNNDNINNNTIL